MTIKTQDGKIITKDGKVSCECCECCLYPAQDLLAGLYTVDDLPETLVAVGQFDNPYSFSMTKTGGADPYYSGTYEGAATRMIIFDGNSWMVQAFNPDDGWLEPQDRAPFECLIFNPPCEICQWRMWWEGIKHTRGFPEHLPVSPGTAYVEDQFADTYTVSGPISGTVTRQSICVWAGTNLRLTNSGYQWNVNGNNKSGSQSTPVGSYAGGYSVS
jgi:hypothetical protein